MRPPKPQTPYLHQTYTITLYRRIEGQFPQTGVTERRINFPDGTGYLLVEGVNINVEDVDISLESAAQNWTISLRGRNNLSPRPLSPSKRARAD
jgi:hypothetical protein